ncbi:MAG: hypothetical protein GF419_11685 [Ignavibacteriales bacterium]|nr:hypothetical protein [Ignavibacteriales bacterium]
MSRNLLPHKKMINGTALVILVALSSNVETRAQESVAHPAAAVMVAIPDGWTWETHGAEMIAESEDRSFAVSISLLEAAELDLAAANVSDVIAGQPMEIVSLDPVATTLGGMPALEFSGSMCRGAALFSISLVATPYGEIIGVGAQGEPQTWEKNRDDFAYLINNITPYR